MEKIKIGIIGVGSIAESHIAGYLKLEDCELYAFCDINEARLKAKGEKHGVTRLFTDKDEMLAACPELDAVSVCTWNCAHAECSIAALKAGKNVLCEKPMAMNAKEAEEMKKAADESGKLLMIGFVRRYGNDANTVMDFVNAGTFGEFYYGKATYLRRAGAPGGWFGDKSRSGGGPLIDLGVHVIDLTRYIAGNPKPVSVYGATFKKLGDRNNLKNRGGYASEDANKENDIFDVEDLVSAMIQLMGTKAGFVLDPEVKIFTEENGYLTNISFEGSTSLNFNGLFENEIAHFVECVKNNLPCRSPAEDGVEIMKILDAIYESAKTEHEVAIK